MKTLAQVIIFSGCLLLAAALLSGCSTSSVSKTWPDGTRVKAWNNRFLWVTERFDITVTNQAEAIRVQLGNSRTDTEAIKAVSEGVAKGAIQGLKF